MLGEWVCLKVGCHIYLDTEWPFMWLSSTQSYRPAQQLEQHGRLCWLIANHLSPSNPNHAAVSCGLTLTLT